MIQHFRVNNLGSAVAVIALIAGQGVLAQNEEVQAGQTSTQNQLTEDQLSQGSLSQRSDSELTALTAQWSQLSPEQRRRLLAEVRGRMANNNQARSPQGVIVQRRYGRVVRKSDGSVVLQTRVVQIQPRNTAPQQAQASGPRVTFGIGFEQRNRGPENVPHSVPQAEVTQPTITVGQESSAHTNR
ncbi:MAG: hypothetical protein ACFHXK_20405 [bacterium]